MPRSTHWLDLEIARRRAVAALPALAHDSVAPSPADHDARRPPGPRPAGRGPGRTARGIRAARRPRCRRAMIDADDLRFGPPILRPPSYRDFYAFEAPRADDVGAPRRRSPGGLVPPADLLLLATPRRSAGPDDPVWAPRGSEELDYELEVGALIDTPARPVADRAEEAIGGYFVFNDWSARDLQRDETAVRLGPAKGKDFASSIGPWLVTPDELADARRRGDRLGPGDDGDGQRRRDEPRPLVRCPVLLRPDGRTCVRRRRAFARATSSAAGRSAAAACWRSGTRRSGAISSPATRSS